MNKEITPLMQQYLSIKADYPDAVLFFRLGDFYEMFFEEAEEISALLNLTLTHRGDAPMCGIPYHASKTYIAKLLAFGKKIAVCEQVEAKKGAGIQTRKVIEIITPGTALDDDFLDTQSNNFVAAVALFENLSFSYIDVSTGEFFTTEKNGDGALDFIRKEIRRLNLREILYNESLVDDKKFSSLREENPQILFSPYPDWHFSSDICYKRLIRHFKTLNLNAFSLNENSSEIRSAGMLLEYIEKTSFCEPRHIQNLRKYDENNFLVLDETSIRNLEILGNLRDGKRQFTLLSLLDKAVTPMGHRLLRTNLAEPLISVEEICRRQDKVQFYFDDARRLSDTRTGLRSILDIERFATRIVMEKATARDFNALKQSLFAYAQLISQGLLEGSDADRALFLAQRIQDAIAEEPAIAFNEGNLLKRGYNEALDKDYHLKDDFQSILDEYIEEERKSSGIDNLKVRYNRKIGYYLEVSRGKLDSVPDYFIRKRSLVNGDRFTTEKLSRLETDCVSVADRIIETERNLFFEFRSQFAEELTVLYRIAGDVARCDFFSTLAFCAKDYNWVRPVVDDSFMLKIKNGRHPVVEANLPLGEFVPNDLLLDEKFFALITGPNMAGKSTFLRQNALIVILAQMGSFIPAEKGHIGIVERIFCRVGAQDNLAKGESTFLVEMNETGNILRNATPKSLILMDEIGRGTSTEDGLSIAHAVMEFLLDTVGAKTLFATHYHELTGIRHEKMVLLCPDVVEANDNVIFTRKMKEGASKNSYGIHVAKLAGLPMPVILRATMLLNSFLEKKGEKPPIPEKPPEASLFSPSEMVLSEISAVDCNKITPLEALNQIHQWQKQLR